jgi:transcription-repair coupling factor (superfamily II helicase)
MSEFINGEIDVLVCTTIIETGMDIPNVNTIIIQDADNMGLAQLYQLRGRVGRSSKLGYAYLTYKKYKILNDITKKRLETIREFIEFGAGFKIALKDLEIRGAGNLLGAEQHGNIENIGYSLYCKLLKQEINQIEISNKELENKLKKEIGCNFTKTVVDININSYIPDKYIKKEKERLEIYKNISLINSRDDYIKIRKEIYDKFGKIPECVINLLNISLLKSTASKLGISSITQKHNDLIITLSQNPRLRVDKLIEAVKQENRVFFAAGSNSFITYKNFSYKDTMCVNKFLEAIL